MNWQIKIENFFRKAEQFFNSVHFIPRLLNAFKVGMVAFNDELFKNDKARQREIEKRNEVKTEAVPENKETVNDEQ